MNTHARTTGADTGTLGLGSVLVGSLPATLLTEAAPEKYTVEAVFTRRPDPDELTGILGSETHALLTLAGYPDVVLTVSDRRLEIANTSLEELRDGLGGILSERLADISEGVRARREAAAEQFRGAAEHEQERAAAVAALAESVTFTARPTSHDHVAAGSPTTPYDRVQISDWDDEGGRSR